MKNKKTNLQARTPLMRLLKQAWNVVNFTTENPHFSVADALDLQAQNQQKKAYSRRQFLGNTSKASAAILLGGSLLSAATGCKKETISTNASIVIVGAGMAGLRAANVLKKAGKTATIFEATTRHGGRMYSAKNIMAQGLTTEIGGEFIDTIHEDMLQLATEFGLSLIDTQTDNTLIKEAYFFNNTHYTAQQLIEQLAPVLSTMQADIDTLPDIIAYNDFNAAANTFDNQSIEQYLNNVGATGLANSFLTQAFVTEYGLNADEQSSINMLFLTDPDISGGEYSVFGESDERYKIVGGNQTITDKLAEQVADQIQYDHTLTAIRARTNGGYTLTFTSGATVKDVNADIIIMTLPFSVLRNVELNTNLQLSNTKLNSINNLGYGTNAKLMLGFNSRPWREAGYSGYLFTDNGIQTGWDNSQLQGGTVGGYTLYSGGTNGVQVGTGTPQSQADAYLPKLNQVFANAQASYNGNAHRMHWPSVATAKGSYACYKPNQWTTIGGAEIETADKIFFAGEHCSVDYQGYMNGAAETGRRAAQAVLDLLG